MCGVVKDLPITPKIQSSGQFTPISSNPKGENSKWPLDPNQRLEKSELRHLDELVDMLHVYIHSTLKTMSHS